VNIFRTAALGEKMKGIIKQIAAVQREIFYLLREEVKTK
jgi:hypothetical protein